MPIIDDCINNICKAKYVTKFDLVKGFGQIPLSERAKEISAFVVPDGLYKCMVMPFGMKNAATTFHKTCLQGCVYIHVYEVVLF